MKNWFLKPLLKGILVVMPIVITAWVFWSALKWLNGLGLSALQALGLNALTFPGSGLLIMAAVLFLVGWLLKFSLIDWFYQKLERLLLRFPAIKTLYGAIKDFANMFDQSGHKQQQVALIDLQAQGLGWMVGIITAEQPPQAAQIVTANEETLLTVYLPMSYMVGGYTLFLPESKVKRVDWSFEEAMRFALTAGVSQDGSKPA